MRVEKVVKNGVWGCIYQIMTIILGFVGRTVFIKILGAEYLGISGLFSNVLTVLSMTELGFSAAISYHLYDLLAKNNEKEISAVIHFYRNVYRVVAIVVFSLGMLFVPFLKYIINDSSFSIEYITLIYIIFLLKTTFSYLLCYKQTLARADQKSYLLVQVDMIMHVVMSVTNIIILVLFKNFVVYLIVEILVGFLCRFLQTLRVDKQYPYLKQKAKITPDKRKKIFGDVKNIFFGKVSGVIVTSTDNILISVLVSTVTVGFYSNYSMIIGYIATFISFFTNDIQHGLGNMLATESKEHSLGTINRLTYVLYYLASFCSVCLFNLLNPFIEIWVGGEYLLGIGVVAICVFNFYTQVMKSSVWFAVGGLGYFKEDRNIAIYGAISNLIVSIILGYYIGLAGIFIGTAFSQVTQFFMKSRLLFGKYAGVRSRSYIWLLAKFTLLTVLLCACTWFINGFINTPNEFLNLFIKAVISAVVPVAFNLIVFRKSDSMIYLKKLVLSKLRRRKDNGR